MANESKAHSHPNYVLIFVYLVVLTAASFITVFVHGTLGTGGVLSFILAVALCKASLVALFFMHLKFEGAWKYVLLVPPALLAMVLVLAIIPDVARELLP